jgi:23S rRNA-/tRNA-specific pseudouridylate synthase
MFAAKSKSFASTFGKLLESKDNFIKEYLCVVSEVPKMKSAMIEVPLRFDVNK